MGTRVIGFDAFEREEAMLEARYSRVTSTPTYPWRCPQCSRGIRYLRLFSREPGRTEGPLICSSCIVWNQKWMRVERDRADRDEKWARER
jgi:hypothetical protein